MLVAYWWQTLPASLLGRVDERIFKRVGRAPNARPWWQDAVNQSIMAYADLQIATGIGILTAAFSTMGTISMYHLQVAIYLAWLSSNTHLTAVSLLQTEFREDRTRSTVRHIRIGAMAVLGFMLLVALVPTTSYNWLAIITRSIGHSIAYGNILQTTISPAGIPARCFWRTEYAGGLTPDAAWSFLIIILSYVWKGLLLFRPSQQFLKFSCRNKLQEPLRIRLDWMKSVLEQKREKNHPWPIVRYKLTLGLYVAVWAVFELGESFMASLWICGGGLLWGTLQILIPRQTLPFNTYSTESSWTFGQILPVLLLAVPVLSFIEGYMGKQDPPLLQDFSSTNSMKVAKRANTARSSTVEGLPVQKRDGQRAQEESTPGPTPSNRHRDTDLHHHAIEGTLHNDELLTYPYGSSARRQDDEARRRRNDAQPPWRNDGEIYGYRFIRAAFWGSQVGIAGALFAIFYCELFAPIGTPIVRPGLRATIESDYGFWFIVGSGLFCWTAVAAILLLWGSFFSSLFAIGLSSADEEPQNISDEVANSTSITQGSPSTNVDLAI